jgi:hypothetical protein
MAIRVTVACPECPYKYEKVYPRHKYETRGMLYVAAARAAGHRGSTKHKIHEATVTPL